MTAGLSRWLIVPGRAIKPIDRRKTPILSGRLGNERSINSLDFSPGCFLTPTRRKKVLFLVHVAGVLKKRSWRSVRLPTPLEDVPRRFLDYGNMRRGCPHLSVKLLEVATSSSPVRSAEAESWLKRYVRAGAAFTRSWGQVEAAMHGHDVAIPR